MGKLYAYMFTGTFSWLQTGLSDSQLLSSRALYRMLVRRAI